jgi:bifunctional non-homologous end joining protein LigD
MQNAIPSSGQMMLFHGGDTVGEPVPRIFPQLLNPIDGGRLCALLNDRQHIMQEKHDGRRLLLWKHGDRICGINKLGVPTKFPAPVGREFSTVKMGFVIDGEIVGDQYHAFDLLELDEKNLRDCSYQTRCFHLGNLLASFAHPHIHLVISASTPAQKKTLFERIKAANREGVVFKWSDAPYSPGRPCFDGPQLKYKFCETASFIVGGINAKRSVSLMLLDGGIGVPLGNVTIPPNHGIPPIGAIAECRYLYAHRGGCVIQPLYLGLRDDIRAEECTTAQLKYKQ